MNETELANAAWWVWFWDTVESWAFLGVVVDPTAMASPSPEAKIMRHCI